MLIYTLMSWHTPAMRENPAMKSIQSLTISAALLLPFLVSVTHADNMSFPPDNVFPQKAPTTVRTTPYTQPMAPNFTGNAPFPMPNQPRQAQNYRTPAVAPNMPQAHYARPYTQAVPNQQQMPAYPVNPRQYPYRNNRTPYGNTLNRANNFPTVNNMLPFGNGTNGFNPFSGNNMPFSNGNGMMPKNPMKSLSANNNNFNMPFFPRNTNKKRKKAWGTERNIWPDFYTDFTDEAWDTMTSGPRKLGTMPGGWRFPYISTPDPVTVSDAITNQFPPIMEEAGKMADFSDWGIFDKK